MKKNLLALFAVATFGFASSVMAAPTVISGAPITDTECPVLGEQVLLNLSKGVSGAYDCFEATNSINVGACHSSGSRSTTLTCAQVGFAADGVTPAYNDTQCNDTNVGQNVEVTEPSYRGFRAASTGGSVGAQSLSANCDESTVLELVNQL